MSVNSCRVFLPSSNPLVGGCRLVRDIAGPRPRSLTLVLHHSHDSGSNELSSPVHVPLSPFQALHVGDACLDSCSSTTAHFPTTWSTGHSQSFWNGLETRRPEPQPANTKADGVSICRPSRELLWAGFRENGTNHPPHPSAYYGLRWSVRCLCLTNICPES